jgi:SOS-response transcriptional repressor LexA
MGLADIPEIEDYLQGDFCVCPIVRKAMTLKRFQKLGQYLHLNYDEE